MKLVAWIGLIACVVVSGTAVGQSAVAGSSVGSGQVAASKAALAAVRERVQTLQARNETLRDFLAQYRSLVERRPSGHGEGDEAKQAYEQQLAAWGTQLERLLRRIDGARGAVADAVQQLEAALNVKLPASLAAEVETARQEATAEQQGAEEAIASIKLEPERPAKGSKSKAAKRASGSSSAP